MDALASVFHKLPTSLVDELIDNYIEILRNYHEERWESSELRGGKFCEIVYTILEGYISGVYPESAKKPTNMEQSCGRLANHSQVPDSIRLSIPRALIFLYHVRNRRGVGHVGGDVNPNHMDALVVLSQVKWVMAELVRVFHQTSIDSATQIVESLTTQEMPLVWSIGDLKRVLDVNLDKKSQTLVVLYASNRTSGVSTLSRSIEYSSESMYIKRIIIPGHDQRLWEYNDSDKSITLSPLGIAEAEKIIKATSLLR